MLLVSHVSPGQHEIFGSQHKGLSGYLSVSQQNSFESHLHLGFFGYLSPFNQQQSIAESQSQKSGLLNQVSPGQHRSLLHFKLEHLSSSGQQYMFESHSQSLFVIQISPSQQSLEESHRQFLLVG